MTEKPLISVIMPAYNVEKYLQEALESVLQQSYQPLEVICINDGSTDNTKKVLESLGGKITLIDCEKNGGIGAARNKGIAAAKGDYLAFMDADDIWKLNKLSRQMEEFQKDPGMEIVFTHSEFFLSPDTPEAEQKLRYLPKKIIPGYIPPTALIKRASFERVGYFETRWKVGEFVAWFAKAKEMGLRYAMVPEALHLRRVHQTNTVITQRSSHGDYVKIVREVLERKRNQQT